MRITEGVSHYSQNLEEEEHILEAFKGWGIGRFLDIGAFDAKDLSNTRALYDRGWSGVMIEPNPRSMAKLIAEYGKEGSRIGSRIELIQVAIGSENGLREFYVTPETSASSTFSPDPNAQYDAKIWVRQMIIADVLTQFGHFDMVSIDVEGSSVDIAVDLIVTGARPRCIIVEKDNRLDYLGEKMTQVGYHMTRSNQTNGIFVRP